MTPSDDHRHAAIQRLEAKREFRLHLAAYLLINTMLIVIWAASGAGYFWPIWAIAGWAIGLAAQAYAVYFQERVTEEDIQAEMRRQEPHHTPRY